MVPGFAELACFSTATTMTYNRLYMQPPNAALLVSAEQAALGPAVDNAINECRDRVRAQPHPTRRCASIVSVHSLGATRNTLQPEPIQYDLRVDILSHKLS